MSPTAKPDAAHPSPNDARVKSPGTVRMHEGGSVTRIVAEGQWTRDTAAALDGSIREIAASCSTHRVSIDLSAVRALDTFGAWLVHRTRTELEARGCSVELGGVSGKRSSLLGEVEAADAASRIEQGDALRRSLTGILAVAERIGRALSDAYADAKGMIGFLGLIAVRMAGLMMRPWRLRGTATVFHMEHTGLNAVPIVALLSFLVGVVIAYQGAVQLRAFGADLLVVNLIGISVLRELGILVTAIILAGRSGSAFTAQIGTMKVNQEVDAMRTIGLDVVEVLVLPRLIALLVTLPLLAFAANVAGIAGGAVMAWVVLGIDFATFARQFQADVAIGHFMVGMVKAPVFALTIALVGCYQGLRVGGSAESVGILTTKSVVQAIFLVIVLDAVFSVALSDWGF